MAVPYSKWIFGRVGWYGFLIVLGMALAVVLANREGKRRGLGKDAGTDVALWGIPPALIGARLYYVVLSWEQYASHPITALYLWEGGLALYGGVIGGTLGILLYSRVKKRSFGSLLDCVAPGLALAQAMGRWGNYFNMEAYGREITDARFCFFPLGVLIGEEWHMATFFYESMWNLGNFLALWLLLRKREKEPGGLFCHYLVIYASGRFVIEQLRTDSLYLLGLRASQWLSLGLCAFGAIWLLVHRGKGKRLPLSILGMLCLMARWLLFHHPAGYLGASMVGFGLIFLTCPRENRLWGIGAVGLDLAGLLCGWLGMPFGASFGLAVQAALCCVTLPLGCWMLTLHGKEKEEKVCPSDS